MKCLFLKLVWPTSRVQDQVYVKVIFYCCAMTKWSSLKHFCNLNAHFSSKFILYMQEYIQVSFALSQGNQQAHLMYREHQLADHSSGFFYWCDRDVSFCHGDNTFAVTYNLVLNFYCVRCLLFVWFFLNRLHGEIPSVMVFIIIIAIHGLCVPSHGRDESSDSS